MNEFTTQNILIIGTIITLILAGVYFLSKRNSPKVDNEAIEYDKLKNEISEKLNKLEEDFVYLATSYYLELRLLESDLSTEKQKEILDEYPEVVSEPKVEWNDFVIVNEEGNILNKLLEEKIKDYPDKDSYTLKASFNYMLLAKAKEEAKKIITERSIV